MAKKAEHQRYIVETRLFFDPSSRVPFLIFELIDPDGSVNDNTLASIMLKCFVGTEQQLQIESQDTVTLRAFDAALEQAGYSIDDVRDNISSTLDSYERSLRELDKIGGINDQI